jgi:GxxExxY protein
MSDVEEVARRVIGAAIAVHRALGPGHPESVYEEALAIELEFQTIPFSRQHRYTLTYRGRHVGVGRLDFLVDNCLVVEVKALDELGVAHHAQVLAYLRATGCHLGLLLNFNYPTLTDGVRRIIL